MRFLMPHHPLTNFEIQKCYQNEPRFNGVFSRNNLPLKIKDGAHVINLDEYVGIGTHWIASFYNRNEILAGKQLTNFTSFFCPHDFKKNDGIILSYFKDEWK